MKKISLIFLIFLMSGLIYASLKKQLPDFITESDNVALELANVTQKLNNERIKYEKIIEKIENLKNKKYEIFLLEFFYNLYLKYQLGIANNLAYKIYALTKKQRELNNDYFTLVSLITTEYGEKIMDCIKNRCAELKDLYNERIKWLDIIKDYEKYIGIDLVSYIFEEKYDEKSKKDLLKYLDKKIMQIEQRIYLLESERNIDVLLKANKFKTNENKFQEINKKIKELKDFKYVLIEKIKELENN